MKVSLISNARTAYACTFSGLLELREKLIPVSQQQLLQGNARVSNAMMTRKLWLMMMMEKGWMSFLAICSKYRVAVSQLQVNACASNAYAALKSPEDMCKHFR